MKARLQPVWWVLVGILLLAAACGDGAAESESVPSTIAATAVAPESSQVPSAPTVTPCEIEQCVAAFAGALVSGDLVILTRSFTPLGLRQATVLQDLSGAEGTGGITSARPEKLEVSQDGYEVSILVAGPAGGTRLSTTWVRSPDGIWRVQSLAVLP